MKESFVFVLVTLLPLISCEEEPDFQFFRSGYTLDEKAGAWFKFHHLPLRWESAHMVCQNEGAFLASPTNEEITESLTILMEKYGVRGFPIFTGLKNIVTNSTQKSIEGDTTSNTYTQSSEYCVGLNYEGTKANVSCTDYYPFACYLKTEAHDLTVCRTPDTEYVFDSRVRSCYKVYRDQQKWSEASKICAAQGAHLAIINSQNEADVLWELGKEISSELSVLIGFSSDPYQQVDNGQRAWKTVQGQTLEAAGYDRWLTGEPNNLEERCGSVMFTGAKEDGILNDAPCDLDLMFICEIDEPDEPQEQKEEEIMIPEFTIQEEVPCIELPECDTSDPEYVYNDQTGSCYKLHIERHTWTQAFDICIGEGGHLAVINSQSEAEVIWELARNSSSGSGLSIGFRVEDNQILINGQRIWTTVQGQSLEEAGYAKWLIGEPNSFNENCGSVFYRDSKENGILNDVPCDVDLLFICEVKARMPTQHRN